MAVNLTTLDESAHLQLTYYLRASLEAQDIMSVIPKTLISRMLSCLTSSKVKTAGLFLRIQTSPWYSERPQTVWESLQIILVEEPDYTQ